MSLYAKGLQNCRQSKFSRLHNLLIYSESLLIWSPTFDPSQLYCRPLAHTLLDSRQELILPILYQVDLIKLDKEI